MGASAAMPRAMQRVALILVLFILLMNGQHDGTAPPTPAGPIAVSVRALPHADAGDPARFGPLRLLDAWHLTSPLPAFGGFSSLLVDETGALLVLNDTGEAFRFRIAQQAQGLVAPLPRPPVAQNESRWVWDSESMTRDAVSGRIWVGFEHLQAICRYAPAFARREGCVRPPEVQHWARTGSLESLVRLGDGRFMALAERSRRADGAHEVLLWQGDPVDAATPPPVHLGYRAPRGYHPTDAVWLGGDKLLVLNRRLTLAEGFTAQLALVTMPALEADALLQGEVIATFAPPGLADNFEALALSHEAGRPILWLASDDNHLFLQRSLLLRFALPPEWVSDRPAP